MSENELRKFCKMCERVLPVSDFNKDYNGQYGVQSLCRACFSEHRKEGSRGYTVRRKMVTGRMVWDYLADNPCVDCGEADPRCLEFDHVPELGEKEYNVGEMVNRMMPTYLIRLEIGKCLVRCRNCHMKITHEQNNSWKHMIWMDLMTAVYRSSRARAVS